MPRQRVGAGEVHRRHWSRSREARLLEVVNDSLIERIVEAAILGLEVFVPVPVCHFVGGDIPPHLRQLSDGHGCNPHANKDDDSLKDCEPDEGAGDKSARVGQVPLDLDRADDRRDNARIHFEADVEDKVVPIALACQLESGKKEQHWVSDNRSRISDSEGKGEYIHFKPDSPIAFPTQGQKWSKHSMHRSVTESCLALRGLTILHETHSWCHCPAQRAGESRALYLPPPSSL